MPDVILPASFLALLQEFRPVFGRASFDNFFVLTSGFVHALGKHRITDALRAAGPAASKHFTTYYRFFSRAAWSLDELGLSLLGFVMRVLPADTVELVVDDTLVRRSGKKVALASMHADPLLKQGGRPFHSYGHVYVVLAVHVVVPLLGRTRWALPFMFRLFEGPRRGGRKDSASDKRRALRRRRKDARPRRRVRKTDRQVDGDRLLPCEDREDEEQPPRELRPKKTELAARMIIAVARRFPDMRFRVLADHLYNGKTVLHAVHDEVDNVGFVTRGRPNAALYELPPEREPGKRGRPRVMGARLPKPEHWAGDNPGAFERVQVDMYGHDVTVEIASFVAMSYRSLPGRLLRYVVVRDPDGIYQTAYIISTEVDLPAAAVVSALSRRWPLERTFQDCKQKLGLQDTEVQLPASVRRQPPMTMILYSLVVLWYVLDGHAVLSRTQVADDPWYARTGRPAFTDMLAGLRRMSWAEPFLDPPCRTPSRQQMLAAYLARVVAAA